MKLIKTHKDLDVYQLSSESGMAVSHPKNFQKKKLI